MFFAHHVKSDLIQVVLDRSENRFQLLYDGHFVRLCIYAYKFIPDQEVCLDIVQESFIRLWHNREKYSDESTQLQFLYVTIKNMALNKIRHEKVKLKVPVLTVVSNSIESDIIENEVKGIIWHGITLLPKKYVEVLSLSLQGYSLKEISDKLGKPLQTVKNNKVEAIKLLRARLRKSK